MKFKISHIALVVVACTSLSAFANENASEKVIDSTVKQVDVTFNVQGSNGVAMVVTPLAKTVKEIQSKPGNYILANLTISGVRPVLSLPIIAGKQDRSDPHCRAVSGQIDAKNKLEMCIRSKNGGLTPLMSEGPMTYYKVYEGDNFFIGAGADSLAGGPAAKLLKADIYKLQMELAQYSM